MTGKMKLVCSGISNNGKYIHYYFSAQIRVTGPGLETDVDWSLSVMTDSEDKNSPVYKYGNSYEFDIKQI